MKTKTSELTGGALDWAVAKAMGAIGPCQIHEGDPRVGLLVGGSAILKSGTVVGERRPEYVIFESGEGDWHPSIDWAQGGPLIVKHQIGFARRVGGWAASVDETGYTCLAVEFGDTHLIAACRAIVAAEIGEEVDVPAELCKP